MPRSHPSPNPNPNPDPNPNPNPNPSPNPNPNPNPNPKQALPGLREAGASLDAVDRGMHSLALSIGETAALAERLSARVQVIELQPGRVRLRWGLANPNPNPNPNLEPNPEPNPNATR